MDCDELNEAGHSGSNLESTLAVNSSILDYYKKYGRKRDLEQYFSLSTAETEIRDVSGIFWRNMKSQDSSDSGERKSEESSTELCRISIKCSMPDPNSSQDENTKTKSDSVSPPIITEEAEVKHTDESSNEDNQSHKSMDAGLDSSMNKPFSPTSSITTQRKLEWDSLADVGYAHESDLKTSASNLSTLERLAIKQQYSNNDIKNDTDIGPPTAHSTLVETVNNNKKGAIRKTTRIYKKDVDIVEVNVPNRGDVGQGINVNLTKHISFNMNQDGAVTIENVTNVVNVTPERKIEDCATTPLLKEDKEIQTTFNSFGVKTETDDSVKPEKYSSLKQPVLVNSNTLKKKFRRKKSKVATIKPKSKRKHNKENIPVQEKSTEQVSAAESFEYLPGDVYNQNQNKLEQAGSSNNADNKSSLESSGLYNTTDSSKGSQHSFTKDFAKSIALLRTTLKKHHNDPALKDKLIKELVQKLLKSKYRDDDSSTDFLSGLSFNSKQLGLGEKHLTTSTSDSNNTESVHKSARARKSILRLDKFNANMLASTSQSAPNLPLFSNNDDPVTKILNPRVSNTESDMTSGSKRSSDAAFVKTSSEELYQKYLEALKKEEAYRKHLMDKELFLKQKLVSSETALRPRQPDLQVNNRLKSLIKDLTRNNYDDGSGDASKLEGGPNSNASCQSFNHIREQRNHSVYTLSSANSDDNSRKSNLKKRLQNEIKESKANICKEGHHCHCGHRLLLDKAHVTDSSVQVNICHNSPKYAERQQEYVIKACDIHKNLEFPNNVAHVVSDDITGNKYVCLCSQKSAVTQEVPDNMLIYKCSKISMNGLQSCLSKPSNAIGVQCIENYRQSTCQPSTSKAGDETKYEKDPTTSIDKKSIVRPCQYSQTNIPFKILDTQPNIGGLTSCLSKNTQHSSEKTEQNKNVVQEATRCIQTEISIHPKISDPSLADINIIEEECCAKLICIQNRLITKDSDSDVFVNTEDSKCNTEYRSRSGKNIQSQNKEHVSTSSSDKSNKDRVLSGENGNNVVLMENYAADNYKIPIQGTNMTLMVRIGSTTEKGENSKERGEAATCGVGTDDTPKAEAATCLTAECSKGVQCQGTNIFTENKLDSPRSIKFTDLTPNAEKKSNTFNSDYLAKPCMVHTQMLTYPRNSKPGPKPLLRSNTDTGKFVSCCMQTTNVKKDNATSQESKVDDKIICTEINSANSEKSKSTCGESSRAGSWRQNKCSSSEGQSRKSSLEAADTDPILEIIKDITKRYSKKSVEKSKDKKKCFKEIITVLKYLLDTEDGTDVDCNVFSRSSSARDTDSGSQKQSQKKDQLPTISHVEKHNSDTLKSDSLKSHANNYRKVEEKGTFCDIPKSNEHEIAQRETKDKAVQHTIDKSKPNKYTESSEIQASTDIPATSSDSATCKVLDKIRKECENYHQKRCKSHHPKKCEASSSTSVNCDQCKRVHHCACRGHRCHRSKSTVDKLKKKCVAYNLIIQTSDSMISEDTLVNNDKPLKSIVVKVPHRRRQMENVPFKEVFTKIEKTLPQSPRVNAKTNRSRSLPNDSEISSADDYAKRNCGYTVREYLEINRPDFVEKSSDRQQCLKRISERRNEDPCTPPNVKMVVVHAPGCMRHVDACDNCNTYCGGVPMNCYHYNPYTHCVQNDVTRVAIERATQRQLLSLQLDSRPSLTSFSETELRKLAEDLGIELRKKKLAPKFISEREMKKHSEKIYKSLPEVVQKKEDAKKDNVKKTNLLMANIFKKNLQKKTLRGAVNLSNYSTVIKI